MVLSIEIKFQFPEDFFEDYQYARNNRRTTVERKCLVHKLVMEAFCPMDEFPPDRLKEDWNSIPESLGLKKLFISIISITIHLIIVLIIEYVTPRENIRAAIKHYGGNTANKGKQKDDEFIVFTEPKWNPLYQEWEDIKVEMVKRGKSAIIC